MLPSFHVPFAEPPQAPTCPTCNLRDLCLPAGLSATDIERFDGLVSARQTVRKGELLFQAGSRFEATFAVKAGSFKTRLPMPEGGEQITGLHGPGDLLGFTGVAEGVMACDAVALEDALVCVIDFGRLEGLARTCPTLQRQIHRCMSQALVHDQKMKGLLAQASADERVAEFMLGLSRRQQTLGLSSDELVMQMSRVEIANLLGLRIETISRCLSRLQTEGTLDVRGRRIRVLNPEQLRRAAHGSPSSSEPQA